MVGAVKSMQANKEAAAPPSSQLAVLFYKQMLVLGYELRARRWEQSGEQALGQPTVPVTPV